jgi:hypothetical protein
MKSTLIVFAPINFADFFSKPVMCVRRRVINDGAAEETTTTALFRANHDLFFCISIVLNFVIK